VQDPQVFFYLERRAVGSPSSRPAMGWTDGGPPQGAPLVLGGASPDARGDALVERPGQAGRPYRAGLADRFGLVNLAQRGSGRPDREKQVGIGVQAGGVVTPVGRLSG